jgi:hypothetical protein
MFQIPFKKTRRWMKTEVKGKGKTEILKAGTKKRVAIERV